MRSRKFAGIGLAAAAVLAVGLTIYVLQPAPTPAPSPTPPPTPTQVAVSSPSPTRAPTPTPTASPEPPRTERPRPTSKTAGDRLLPYYFQARQLFPLLPSAPQIDFDEPADGGGEAWFRGLTPVGIPIFAVREDFMMTPRTAFHEIGHAYEELLKRQNPGVDWRARYWTYRGFPATWQDAARESAAQTGMAQWISSPQESWAEAFSVSIVGSGREKTHDYGKTINPPAMLAFFQSLAAPPASR